MKLFFPSIQKIFLGIFVSLFGSFCTVLALDVLDINIPSQWATSYGSNGSQVWFSLGGVSTEITSYWNKNNDSDVIGNYLRGYYYDSQFGFFKLDWNGVDMMKNVHIISSTDKCGSWYGYKFSGYAYSDTAGYINFNYDTNNFVYYCEADKKLHGYAYGEQIGFQNFEWISFEVVALAQNNQSLPSGNDPFFVNNNSTIIMNLPPDFNPSTIQWKGLAGKLWQEVIFYIIK